MLKTWLTTYGFILCTSTAYAADLKVTSFNFIGYRSTAAEICGNITGEISAIAIVDITADPTYKSPGQYSTVASKDGKFCVVINTVTGKADAKLRSDTSIVSAKIN